MHWKPHMVTWLALLWGLELNLPSLRGPPVSNEGHLDGWTGYLPLPSGELLSPSTSSHWGSWCVTDHVPICRCQHLEGLWGKPKVPLRCCQRLVFFRHACSVAESSPTLCDPMDLSVHGIFQARILEWVAISSSRGSSQLRDRTHLLCFLHWQVGSLPLAPLGNIYV